MPLHVTWLGLYLLSIQSLFYICYRWCRPKAWVGILFSCTMHMGCLLSNIYIIQIEQIQYLLSTIQKCKGEAEARCSVMGCHMNKYFLVHSLFIIQLLVPDSVVVSIVSRGVEAGVSRVSHDPSVQYPSLQLDPGQANTHDACRHAQPHRGHRRDVTYTPQNVALAHILFGQKLNGFRRKVQERGKKRRHEFLTYFVCLDCVLESQIH